MCPLHYGTVSCGHVDHLRYKIQRKRRLIEVSVSFCLEASPQLGLTVLYGFEKDRVKTTFMGGV